MDRMRIPWTKDHCIDWLGMERGQIPYENRRNNTAGWATYTYLRDSTKSSQLLA